MICKHCGVEHIVDINCQGAVGLEIQRVTKERDAAKAALANCHMSARRGIASPTVAHQQLLHIVRFCEEAGVTLDILRTRDDYGVVHEDSGSR
jgi:hypothetical protein